VANAASQAFALHAFQRHNWQMRQIIVLLITAFSTSPAVSQSADEAPPFASFALERFRQGRFAYLRPINPSAESVAEVPDSLIKFYAAQLPAELKATSWQALSLPPVLHLPQSRPIGALWNTHLVWALDAKGQRLAGFRPVDTSTECSSGCTPVVFHLGFNTDATQIRLIEDPLHPLRKLNHAPFSDADRARVQGILNKVPQAYETLRSPTELTDSDGAWPPRTWTYFAPTLVEGGAYTSFRIYQAALPLKRFLSEGNARFLREEDDRRSVIGDSLRVMTASDAWKRLKELSALISDARTPSSHRASAQSFVPEILLWLVQHHAAKSSQVATFLRAPWLKNERVRLLCGFYRDLLRSPQGASLLLEVHQKKQAPSCPSAWAEHLPGLAAIAANATPPAGWDPSKVPEELRKDPELALLQLKALKQVSSPEIFVEAYAAYLLRFPKAAVWPDAKKPSAAQLKSAEAAYRRQLATQALSPPEPLPQVEVVDLRGKTRKLDLSGKQILVFFGSWCEHCQQLLRSWATEFPKSLWPRLQLVETFATAPSLESAKQLCTSIPLPKANCEGLLRLPSPESAPEFHNALGLHNVPRLLILDRKGQIRAYDHRYDDTTLGSDPARDLDWLVQEINKQ
jgi:hypothetical protein